MAEKKITIKHLDKLEEMLQAYPLIKQVYEKMDFETYQAQLAEMIALNDFRMVAAFHNEKLIGISGYWISLMLYCGRYLQISSFVVDKESRGLGAGKIILNHLEQVARKAKCQKYVLDSYTENKRSHPLFFREGFYIRGFHFMKDL